MPKKAIKHIHFPEELAERLYKTSGMHTRGNFTAMVIKVIEENLYKYE